MVLAKYQAARAELSAYGMTLRHSPPPVKGRMRLIGDSAAPFARRGAQRSTD